MNEKRAELLGRLKAYAEQFEDDFPTIPLMLNRTEDEVIEIIDRCLREGRDVYEIGYLPFPDADRAVHI